MTQRALPFRAKPPQVGCASYDHPLVGTVGCCSLRFARGTSRQSRVVVTGAEDARPSARGARSTGCRMHYAMRRAPLACVLDGGWSGSTLSQHEDEMWVNHPHRHLCVWLARTARASHTHIDGFFGC